MVDWNPRDEMGLLRYLKFKLGSWVQVSTLPEWVHKANAGYYEGYIEKYGQRPYNVEKIYTGNSLKYKIFYKTVGAPGRIEEEYYTKIK
ncbi:hypothetical protein [Natronorubrum sulfidifaciens]|uniref:hypothetical protein n=1 Tax=Natronorubrum sulfidifaciens TaxID=388259 RepID=UPI001266FBCD|nr:hypothetical protein [Natronorubrum sulfidifaciens]